MPSPVHVPRVNNNDDNVRVVDLGVKEGDFVVPGQIVGAVETDKAVLDVPVEQEGYVLKILYGKGDTAAVGSVLLWLGKRIDEPTPEQPRETSSRGSTSTVRPTAKAQAMLQEHGLRADSVPAAGERLTVADIEAWLKRQGQRPAAPVERPPQSMPSVPGESQELSVEERGMLSTVIWHRDAAAPAYLEIEYDPGPWNEYAARYAKDNKLLLSPLLALLAYRLVEIAKANLRINATIVDDRRYQYRTVNLGFTVQVENTLYLAVVAGAEAMDAAGFIAALGEVQRHAMAHRLRPSESSGATLAFSSMARWNVSRHVPILPPYTGLIVSHAAPRGAGTALLGATYDHRLLTGFDVASVLQTLAQAPA